MASFPSIGYSHPTCWVRNFIHNLYLVDINLLFPRKSCSIGYRYPLESINSVRKLNLVIFAHCPLVSATPIWFYVGILLISTFWNSVLDNSVSRKSRRASFLRTISVKSGIEPVYLSWSNYTSTGWSTTSALVLISALKEQDNPKVCEKIQVYKGTNLCSIIILQMTTN